MLTWKRTGRKAYEDGGSDVVYEADSPGFRIESRKRFLPHSGRPGGWYHTSYFLLTKAGEKEYFSLADAKEAAEALLNGGRLA